MAEKRGESIVGQRLEKLDRLRRRGIEPYPPRYKRTHTATEARSLFEQHEKGDAPAPPEVSLAGRIMSNRVMGKATFLDIRDGSGKIQVYLRRDLLGDGGRQRLVL